MCSPLLLSSISGQYQIHRHRQKVLHNNQRKSKTDHNCDNDVNHSRPPSVTAVSLASGVSPAIAAAAVRAAPSPTNLNQRFGYQRMADHPALKPFNSFDSITKNEDNVTVMHQPQTGTNAASMSNNVSMCIKL